MVPFRIHRGWEAALPLASLSFYFGCVNTPSTIVSLSRGGDIACASFPTRAVRSGDTVCGPETTSDVSRSALVSASAAARVEGDAASTISTFIPYPWTAYSNGVGGKLHPASFITPTRALASPTVSSPNGVAVATALLTIIVFALYLTSTLCPANRLSASTIFFRLSPDSKFSLAPCSTSCFRSCKASTSRPAARALASAAPLFAFAMSNSKDAESFCNRAISAPCARAWLFCTTANFLFARDDIKWTTNSPPTPSTTSNVKNAAQLSSVAINPSKASLSIPIAPFAHANGPRTRLYDSQFAFWRDCSLAQSAGRA